MNETETTSLVPEEASPPVEAAVASMPPRNEVGNVLKVSDTMVTLTWLAFLIACFALYKLAWKPILQALDRREDKIRQSLKEAADIQAQAAMDREAQRMMLEEARREAAAIVERARSAAEAAAQAAEEQSRAEAENRVRAAAEEIGRAKEKAVAELRREASGLALDLAGRVLGKKLDAEADRELTDRLIREIG